MYKSKLHLVDPPSVVYKSWSQFLVFLKPICEGLWVLVYREAKEKQHKYLQTGTGW